jgi:hypothetical protein
MHAHTQSHAHTLKTNGSISCQISVIWLATIAEPFFGAIWNLFLNVLYSTKKGFRYGFNTFGGYIEFLFMVLYRIFGKWFYKGPCSNSKVL